MIRVGIGGWTFEPWRGVFFPEGLRKAEELRYASRQLRTIEVNGTFYRTQTPATFARWAAETPAEFTFSLKAPRGTTHRNDLAEAEPSIRRFLESGIDELGGKLGPILWQFSAAHRFSPDNFRRFADMLPPERGGRRLRHVVEAAHPSYRDPAFLDILRSRNVALAVIDDEGASGAADLTADFVYARLKAGRDEEPLCYPEAGHRLWTARVTAWEEGRTPDGPPRLRPAEADAKPRDCFVYFISGGKVRAPAAAQALQRALG